MMNENYYYDHLDRSESCVDAAVSRSSPKVSQTMSDAAADGQQQKSNRHHKTSTSSVVDWLAEKQNKTKDFLRKTSDRKKRLKRQDSAPEALRRQTSNVESSSTTSPHGGTPQRKSRSVRKAELLPPSGNVKQQSIGMSSSPNLIHYGKFAYPVVDLTPSSAATSQRAISTENVTYGE